MLHIPIVFAHDVSKQIRREKKNFQRVENVIKLKKLELISATPRATLTHLSTVAAVHLMHWFPRMLMNSYNLQVRWELVDGCRGQSWKVTRKSNPWSQCQLLEIHKSLATEWSDRELIPYWLGTDGNSTNCFQDTLLPRHNPLSKILC